MTPELILNARADLGEGPAWDETTDRLYWVDIQAGNLHTFDPLNKIDEYVNMGEKLGSVAPCKNGDLVMALESGIATYHLPTRIPTRLVNPEEHIPGNRFNDGKCDPTGRFLAGTMDNAEIEASGSLYSFSHDGSLKTLLTGTRISNGLTWSPDYKTFYHIDTPSRQVTAYDYLLETGDISNPRAVATIPGELGWPDGMTSDEDGMLWVAMWGGAKITRWNPVTGNLLESIPLPALNITSCIFGGPSHTDLYVTSARKGMSPDQLAKYPLSGGLFRIKTGIKGMPTFAFGN